MKRLINWVLYHKLKFIILVVLILLGNIFPEFGKLIKNIVVYGILIGVFILIWLLKDNNFSSFNNTPVEYDEEIIIPEKSEFEKQQEEFINYHYYWKKDMGPLAEDKD